MMSWEIRRVRQGEAFNTDRSQPARNEADGTSHDEIFLARQRTKQSAAPCRFQPSPSTIWQRMGCSLWPVSSSYSLPIWAHEAFGLVSATRLMVAPCRKPGPRRRSGARKRRPDARSKLNQQIEFVVLFFFQKVAELSSALDMYCRIGGDTSRAAPFAG